MRGFVICERVGEEGLGVAIHYCFPCTPTHKAIVAAPKKLGGSNFGNYCMLNGMYQKV
jgi:hypothetical protein